MQTQQQTPPSIVQELARQAKGNPIAWAIHESTVVIVFEDGRKLSFDRQPGPVVFDRDGGEPSHFARKGTAGSMRRDAEAGPTPSRKKGGKTNG